MSAGAEQIAAMINRFGRDLYSCLSAGDARGNLFFSPLSIHAALGMALAGAKGKTARELGEVLHWPADAGDRAAYAELLADMIRPEHGSQRLVIANALWAQAGYPPVPDYVRRVVREFAGQAMQLDFGRADEAAASINDWVEEHTARKIRNLVSPGSLNPLTRLVLTNAIYFKGDWRRKFDPADTADAPFHLLGGGAARVSMMHQTAHFRAAEKARYSVIDLHYADYGMSMWVFLPKSPHDLPWLERTVIASGDALADEALPWREVELFLPRFRIETTLAVAPLLASMGVADAFDPAAVDFSGITPDGDVWLSDVIHKAYLDVNEEGTEAAGATAAALAGGLGPEPDEPIVIRVDRPFIFALTAWSSLAPQTLLFMGRVMEPAR